MDNTKNKDQTDPGKILPKPQKDLPTPEKDLPLPEKDLPLPEKDLPLPEKEISAHASHSQHTYRKGWWLVFFLLCSLILAATIYFFYANKQATSPVIHKESINNKEVFEKWENYTNEKYGISIDYPANLFEKGLGSYAFLREYIVGFILEEIYGSTGDGVPALNREYSFAINADSLDMDTCYKGPPNTPLEQKIVINGTEFQWGKFDGNIDPYHFTGKIYRTYKNNRCYEIAVLNRIGLFYSKEAEMNVNKRLNTMEQILSTFKFLN